jgi:LemA protein
MAIIVILVAIVVVGVLFIGVYNGLVTKRVATENAWAQIDVQLKRRHDLIPNLVETVKGYAAHEKQTLERVIQARNVAVNAAQAKDIGGQIQAENVLTGALKQLFALSESYPNLKANENFAQLQEEIASTENRVGFARQHYNDCVAAYNSATEQVPGNFVRGFGNFPHKEFFELGADEAQAVKEPPKVSF